MSYAAALFCQYFREELRRPGSLRKRVIRAITRLSPNISCAELRIYASALVRTISVNSRELRPDWAQRVAREH
jgi:hypothetical protein